MPVFIFLFLLCYKLWVHGPISHPLWDKLTILFYTPGMIFHFFKSHFAKAKIIKLNYLQEPWEIIVLIRKF